MMFFQNISNNNDFYKNRLKRDELYVHFVFNAIFIVLTWSITSYCFSHGKNKKFEIFWDDYSSAMDMEDFHRASKIILEGMKNKIITNYYAYALQSTCLARQGELFESEKFALQSLRLSNPNPEPSALFALSLVKASRGEAESALLLLQDANKLTGINSPECHEDLGYYYMRFQKFDEAKNEFVFAKRISNSTRKANSEYISLIPLCYLNILDNLNDCIKYSSMELKENGIGWYFSSELVCVNAYALSAVERGKEAEKLLKIGIEKSPDGPIFKYILRYLVNEISPETLLDHAQRSDKYKEPYNQIRANVWIGLNLFQKGKTKESVPYLQWAIDHQVTESTGMYVQVVAIPLLQKIRNGVPINPGLDKARSAPPRRAAPSNKNQRKAKR